MATVTLTEPPAPFSCLLCARPQWARKAGDGCNACPAFVGTHYHPLTLGPEGADLIVVGDVPAPPPRLVLVGGRDFKVPKNQHETFEDVGGKVVKAAIDRVLSRGEFTGLQVLYTYAVKCAVDNPNKKTVLACASNLRAIIHMAAIKRKEAGRMNKLAVLACGVDSLIALGLKPDKEEDCLNRVYSDVDVGGVLVNVVFTRSLKALATQDGKFNTLLSDVERVAMVATSTLARLKSREEIEKGYVYPRSLDEVRQLVDYVIRYTEGDVLAQDWKISFDTETNTLNPNWDGLKLLSVSFAWSDGKAASVVLWHPQNVWYDPAQAYEEVKRLLASRKPLIWFNGKYDYKVFWKLGWPLGDVGNTFWDAFLAEHVLEEDKKKFYSLKMLTKQHLPELAGYEDKLHDILDEENDKADVVTPSSVGKPKELKLPSAVVEAVAWAVGAKIIKGNGFQVKTLEKALAKTGLEDEARKRLLVLINAKKSGEFRAGAGEKKVKEVETGGFEKIPINELNFYAAVDADATRRIAVKQVRRMAVEDQEYNKHRAKIVAYQQLSRDPRDKIFPVEVLCRSPRPRYDLARNDYVPRQIELAKIEYNGMRVDLNYCRWGMESLGQTIEHTKKQIFELADGEEFKLGSTQKLARLLFGEGYRHPDPEKAEALAAAHPGLVSYVNGRISYKPQAYTEKGAIQTTDGVLKSLVTRYECPLSNLLLANKKADKGKNTFFANIDALARYFGDDRLHSGYGLASTSTGRLASSVKIGDARFNAQNIPKGLIGALRDLHGALVLNDKGKPVFEGVNCKKLFIPDDDSYCFVNADAKGAEVSIYAAYSHDEALIAALIDGLDAHCFFASECLNPRMVAEGLTGEARRVALANAGIDDDHAWTYEDFLLGKDGLHPDKAYGKRLKKLRDNIKRLVFGMLYGAGIKKIAEIAGISYEFAKQIQTLLFTKFPTIRTFMERTKWELRTFSKVEAFNGRLRRFLIGANAPGDLRAQAERRAINFKVQGTNSDIVLTVLCAVAPVIEHDLGGRLLLTVHDSIGAQVKKKYAHQVPEIIKEYGSRRVAQAFPWLPVPYRWDVEMGPSYGEVGPAENYLAGLPQVANGVEFVGYTEEEQFDDLRDPDAFDLPERTRDPNKEKKK